jgi:putative sigma-54 modulation protein
MQTHLTFRHTKSDPVLQEAATEAARKFEKFYDGITKTEVVFIADTGRIVEFTVHVKGETLVVKENTEDFTKSLHQAADKMIRQLRKWKTKLTMKPAQKLAMVI